MPSNLSSLAVGNSVLPSGEQSLNTDNLSEASGMGYVTKLVLRGASQLRRVRLNPRLFNMELPCRLRSFHKASRLIPVTISGESSCSSHLTNEERQKQGLGFGGGEQRSGM